MKKILTPLLDLLAAMTGVLIFIFLMGLPTMLLWNWIMPIVFGLPKITFFQAIGLQILSKLIFPNSSKEPK